MVRHNEGCECTRSQAEWWTTTDVAEYIGVKISTVSNYRRRAQMPEPDTTIRSISGDPTELLSGTARDRPQG